MSAPEAEPMILAIGRRDDFLHVYPDQQALLRDDTIGAGPGERSGPLEFFDSHGHRLTGEFDQKWCLLRLVTTAEPPNPDLVRQRISNAVEHLRSYLANNPELVESSGLTVQDAVAQIPAVDSGTGCEISLAELFSAHLDFEHESINISPAQDELAHPGSPVHNWRHAAGFHH